MTWRDRWGERRATGTRDGGGTTYGDGDAYDGDAYDGDAYDRDA